MINKDMWQDFKVTTYIQHGTQRPDRVAWFHCPRCGRDGYAGTLGHGCTDCDNHFSHGLPDPVDQDADESTVERYLNEGGR